MITSLRGAYSVPDFDYPFLSWTNNSGQRTRIDLSQAVAVFENNVVVGGVWFLVPDITHQALNELWDQARA